VHRWTAAAFISLSLAIVASSVSLYHVASRDAARVTFPASVAVQISPVVRRPPVPVAFDVGPVPNARGGAAVAPTERVSARPAAPPCGPFLDPGSTCGIA
jgi:hypothetical protein